MLETRFINIDRAKMGWNKLEWDVQKPKLLRDFPYALNT